MSRVKYLFLYAFYLMCCVLTIWMAMRELTIYFKNEDSSSINYKRFHKSIENYYPDLSICSINNEGSQFNESKLPNGIRSADFVKILDGKEAKELENEHMHKHILKLLIDLSKNDGVAYDDLLADSVNNIIEGYGLLSREGKEKGSEELPDFSLKMFTSKGKLIFNKTFDSNGIRCWTRKLNYVPGQLTVGEGVNIENGALENVTELYVKLHLPNQVFRSTTAVAVKTLMEVTPETRKLPVVVITVIHIQLITRRHDSKEQCDKELRDDDTKQLQIKSKALGCIPVFWKRLSASWINMFNLSYCTKPEEYRKYFSKYRNRPWSLYEEYDPPCT